MEQRGFHIHSISSPIGKSYITEDFTVHLKGFMRAIELTKFFDTPFIRIFSFYIPKGENIGKYRDEVIKRIEQLTRTAEREGIILMLENEKDLYGNNGERLRDILQTINSPHLRFALDPANFVQSMVLPMTDAFPEVEPYLAWVQIKDALINSRSGGGWGWGSKETDS
ncbi:sugar phosphate isomerase/epimerase family protein [Paenibacillus alginolyticus]|uniref:sugar phosphate isomerase/epimerase family protein n=1 Tax=Paenibacillus alginolyticus TaxID=59839 RepID=UPI0009FCEE7B|nr:TIM barrel protein [Paenibacillus alginolyticus]MEC0144277.1 TIM barrel protein [Paenibacillus alginolyticus]